MNLRSHRFCVVVFTFLLLFVLHGSIRSQTLSFEQLNWFGLSSSTSNSPWGFATLDFTGFSDTEFFNLNVNGRWVVQNMGIDSLYGAGTLQAVRTTFDLGVSAGTDVTSLQYVYAITSDPISTIPTGAFTSANVSDLDYQIGGEGGVDLGSPGAPPPPVNVSTKPEKSGKLPDINKFVNQVQKPNECAPGAVSNSLKYLQATGKVSQALPTSISDIRPILGTTATGSPTTWMQAKKDHFDPLGIRTEFVDSLSMEDICKVINAINAGNDVELRLVGHVEVVAGARYYPDGTIELDLFDDDQKDNLMDPMHTSKVSNGKIDGLTFGRFLIESVPEPSIFAVYGLGLVSLIFCSWRRARR